ncbi:MAG: serine hydrolase [Herbinix sp.]|jgi:CubicO group peptidase (beta-lactamase class C family)|nr:serine hydrolase [Herbinix sp.]
MIRKWMRSGISILLAVVLIALPTNLRQVSAASTYDEVAKQAQTTADLLTAVYGATSVQYALIDGDEIVISGQSGDYEKGGKTELTKEHMYGIGSISKMFVTAAVMQLVEEGKVKLDTPVVKYLPKFKMTDSRYKNITVRMILNHSSGIMGSTLNNAELFDDNDTLCMDILLDTLKDQRLKADPGAFSVYCNDGFSLAQLLVEEVSGLGFSEYMSKNISNPLSLKNTKTPLDEFEREQLAKTYLLDPNRPTPIENLNAIGAGGIYSTAEELCLFGSAFFYEGKETILTEASARAMAQSEYKNGLWYPESYSMLSYGLGWDSVFTYPYEEYGIKALVKGGDTTLFHGSLVVLPEKGMAMAVLLSGGSSAYSQVFAQNVLLKALLAKGEITEIKADKIFTAPVKAEMPSSELENEGYYVLLGGTVKVEISDAGILDLYSGVNPQKFIYTGEGKFYSQDGSTFISFIKEGNITYLYVEGYGTLPYLGQMANSCYQGQKVEPNPLSKKVKAAWNEREGKLYFLLNEKYDSVFYPLSAGITKIQLTEGLEGYFANAQITDANNAKMLYQIPGLYGRDMMDLSFYTKAKVEYLKAAGTLFMSEDGVTAMSLKNFKVTIGKEGYAQWYKFGSKSKGKKLKLTLPKNASVTVYDKNLSCTYYSITTDKRELTLPEGGYIAFAGKAGAKFSVSDQK